MIPGRKEAFMRCIRTPIKSTVYKYELGKGFEDGFEPYSEVVTKGWFVTDNLVKVTRDNGLIVCPYINHRRGRTFVCENDYVIVDDDGTKHLCGHDKIFDRYDIIEE